jgi:hypothetical protein
MGYSRLLCVEYVEQANGNQLSCYDDSRTLESGLPGGHRPNESLMNRVPQSPQDFNHFQNFNVYSPAARPFEVPRPHNSEPKLRSAPRNPSYQRENTIQVQLLTLAMAQNSEAFCHTILNLRNFLHGTVIGLLLQMMIYHLIHSYMLINCAGKDPYCASRV